MTATTVAKAEYPEFVQLFLDRDSAMEPQFVGIEAHVTHINSNISDIKTEQRRIDDKFDKKFDDMTPRLDAVRDKIEVSTAAVSKRIDDTSASLTTKLEGVHKDVSERVENVRKEVTTKVEAARSDLSGRIEDVRVELTGRTETVRSELVVIKDSLATAKIWALSLHITQAAALLYVIARGLKWL